MNVAMQFAFAHPHSIGPLIWAINFFIYGRLLRMLMR